MVYILYIYNYSARHPKLPIFDSATYKREVTAVNFEFGAKQRHSATWAWPCGPLRYRHLLGRGNRL